MRGKAERRIPRFGDLDRDKMRILDRSAMGLREAHSDMRGMPMKFIAVSTIADLETLEDEQILEGYRSAERGDPEPGPNRGRSFWHGWRNRMMDLGELPGDEASRSLAREYLAAQRQRRATEGK
ncbi:hypothetical protein [Bradyrhizobium erythrophlei]|nr:hypothetical protein [Bradyrhizobium erythrophlei]